MHQRWNHWAEKPPRCLADSVEQLQSAQQHGEEERGAAGRRQLSLLQLLAKERGRGRGRGSRTACCPQPPEQQPEQDEDTACFRDDFSTQGRANYPVWLHPFIFQNLNLPNDNSSWKSTSNRIRGRLTSTSLAARRP